MVKCDYIVVGSGVTGATIARLLADAGREVVVLERRSHVGGNVHDTLHGSGIRVHTYGPHYFRTNSHRIWEFAIRFGKFYDFSARVMSFVDGRYEHWPITNEYIKRTAGESGSPSFHGTATNFEEVALSMMPKLIYEKLVKGYTEKQWGVPAPSLSASLAKRFDIRSGEDVRLSRHRHQGLPVEGYHSWITNMLAGIYLLPNTDYTEMRSRFTHKRKLIFTGPIDEFFSFRAGRLKYRGQRRTHVYLPNTKYFQPFAQVNNPDQGSGPHIRTLEWKHIMEPGLAASTLGTVITTETPFSSGDPDNYEYPFPDESNHRLYLEYAGMASQLADVIICGRLGEYRYYDMDQAIARAMTIADHVLSGDISRFGQSRALKVLPTCCAATSN